MAYIANMRLTPPNAADAYNTSSAAFLNFIFIRLDMLALRKALEQICNVNASKKLTMAIAAGMFDIIL